jgi:GcrA cell cycle regulator
MQSTDWAPEHSEALREYLAKGMSFSEAARAINAKFNTAYSRSAALGRASRMRRADLEPPKERPSRPMMKVPYLGKPWERERYQPLLIRPMPVFRRATDLKLRCIEIAPRHLSLLDLGPSDCHYPYGGHEEGEATTFCGHRRRAGSRYCAAHHRLTHGRGIALGRTARAVLLRQLRAA